MPDTGFGCAIIIDGYLTESKLAAALQQIVSGGWLGDHLGLRAALGFAGTTALVLAAIASRLQVIRSVKTLPTLKAEAITPYSSERDTDAPAA